MKADVSPARDAEQKALAASGAELRQAGLEYLQRGQWSKAVECFSRLAEWLPDDEEIAGLLEEATFKIALEEQESSKRRSQVMRRAARLALVGAVVLSAAFGFSLLLRASFRYSANQAEARKEYEASVRMALSLRTAKQHLLARQYAEAEQLYEDLLAQHPDSEEAQMGLAETREQAQLASLYSQALAAKSQGQLRETLDRWRAIEELSPNYADVAERMARLERNMTLAALLGKAEQSYEERQWQEAIELYRELQREAPQFEAERVSAHLFESYLNGGFELLVGEEGVLPATDVSEAHDLFAQALVLRPRESRAVAGRELVQTLSEGQAKCGEDQACFLTVVKGLYRQGMGNGEEMLALLIVRMHLSLAEALEADGSYELALQHYRRAVDLDVGGEEGALAQEGATRLAKHFPLTPTVTPVPIETPTPMESVLPEAQVRVRLLNLRAGPSSRHRIVATLPKDFSVTVSGIDQSGYWVKASTVVGEGWLHIAYLIFPGGRPELPLVTGE